MEIKKYIAETFAEALLAVKADLGPDAVVLATRSVSRGIGFGRAKIEVMAARQAGAEDTEEEPAGYGQNALPKAGPKGEGPRSTQTARATEPQLPEPDEERDWIGELRATPGELAFHQPDDESLLLGTLEAADVDPSIAKSMLRMVRQRFLKNQKRVPVTQQLGYLKYAIQETLIYGSGSSLDEEVVRRGRIEALVGPTGVGKTTTIAKLAANAVFVQNKKVALLTFDTYRVAAVEQLRQYATLLGAPLEVLRSRDAFAKACARHASADLILVDTAGRGPNQADPLKDLASAFAEREVVVHLTLAVSTRQQELRRILEQYSFLTPNSLIFSKLDEAVALGAMLNAAFLTSTPISYLTQGQRVPEDIARFDAAYAANQMIDRVKDWSVAATRSPESGRGTKDKESTARY